MQEIPDSFGTCHPKQTYLKPVNQKMQHFYKYLKIRNSFHIPTRTSATPRSDILSVPSVVSKRLLGFMSLCIMPWLCKYSSPAISWQKYLYNENQLYIINYQFMNIQTSSIVYPWACQIGNFFSGLLSSNSCKPETQYSKMRYIFCFSELCKTSNNLITFL